MSDSCLDKALFQSQLPPSEVARERPSGARTLASAVTGMRLGGHFVDCKARTQERHKVSLLLLQGVVVFSEKVSSSKNIEHCVVSLAESV